MLSLRAAMNRLFEDSFVRPGNGFVIDDQAAQPRQALFTQTEAKRELTETRDND